MQKVLSILAACLILFSACKKTEDNTTSPQPHSSNDSIMLRSHVHIVDSSKMKLNTSPALIASGKFEFTLSNFKPDYKVGDIIVVETNGGYLRQITTITSAAKKVSYGTTASSMSQVFEKGEFSFHLNSDSLRLVHKGYTLNLSNVTVYQNGPLSIKLNSGRLNFDPDWNFDFDFNSNGLRKFQMGCTDAVFSGNFDLSVAASQSVNAINRIDTLAKLTKSYIKWIVVGEVPFPVIVVMDVRFLVKSNLSFNAAVSRKINISTNNKFNIGIKYENSRWDGIYKFTPSTDFTLDQSIGTAGFTYNFYIYPEVSIKLYNVAGPYASIALRTQMQGNLALPSLDWDQNIKAWLETTVGADVAVLDKTLANYSKTWSTDSITYNEPDSIIKVSGDNQAGQPNLYLAQPIKIRVVDSRGKSVSAVPVYFTVTSGGGSVQDASIMTDANGYAQTYWKIGTQVTGQKVEVNVKKANGTSIQNVPVEFDATSSSSGTWSELGGTNNSTFNNTIASLAADDAGNIYAAGYFQKANGQYYLAKWNGGSWGELTGTTNPTFLTGISSVTTDAAGNVYPAGVIYENGDLKSFVAKWNGSNWSQLGGNSTFNATFNSTISSLTTDVAGNIYAAGSLTNAGGQFYVAKWNGNAWSELGGTNNSTFNGSINSLTTDASGIIYAAGQFKNASGKYYVAKWNGSNWSELGGTNNSTFTSYIYSITKDASGNIYAAGDFLNTFGKRYVAKWSGSAWSALGGNSNLIFDHIIQSLAIDAHGNVYAAGWFTNLNGGRYVAKWDGSAWTELGGNNNSTFNNNINSLTADASGNVYAAGEFTNANGKHYVAKFTK